MLWVMRWLVGAVLVATCAAARADIPVERALEAAAIAGRPLVLVFHAKWCGPCRLFERNVLPRGDVQRALASVAFVRYDIETAEGAAAARRYKVGGVPAIVVVDVDGTQRSRLDGLVTAEVLLGAITAAKLNASSLGDLETAVRTNPRDVSARLRLASYHGATGHIDEAIAAYTQVADDPATPVVVAAEAHARATELATARSRLTVTLDAAATLAQRFPRSPRASRALVELGLARHLPEPALQALVAAHLNAVEPGDRRTAVHAALAIGETAAAARAVARWERADPNSAELELLAAEVNHYDGRPATARARISRLCKQPPSALALRCYELVHASANDDVPGVANMRDAAMRTIRALEGPGDRLAFGTERMWSLEPQLGNSLALALFDVHRTCAAYATKHEHVYLDMHIPAVGPAEVRATSESGPLQRCIEMRLQRARLDRTRAERFSTFLELEPAGRASRKELAPSAPLGGPRPFGRGVLIGFVVRGGGDMVSTSVGTGFRGRLALARRDALHLVGAWDLEGSVDDGGDGIHVARGYAGVGLLPTKRIAASLVAGVGSTSFGSLVEQSYEVPVEAALRMTLSSWARGHLVARVSTLLGASARNRSGFADELGLGCGINLRANTDAWLSLGATLEMRRDGTSTVLSVGIPIGSYY